MLNADLALSVAMTTCSTACCILFMPLNLLMYVRGAYGEVPNLEWWRLVMNIAVAMVAIICGTITSLCFPKVRNCCNSIGNVAGITLIVFGIVVSNNDEPIWTKEPIFYPAVASPCVIGLCCSFSAALCSRTLTKPEVVAVTVETAYQNTGLALSIALATFEEDDVADAAAVPLFYAAVQVILLPLFLISVWKLGFTYAPPNTSILKTILFNWQPSENEPQSDTSDSLPDENAPPEKELAEFSPWDGKVEELEDNRADEPEHDRLPNIPGSAQPDSHEGEVMRKTSGESLVMFEAPLAGCGCFAARDDAVLADARGAPTQVHAAMNKGPPDDFMEACSVDSSVISTSCCSVSICGEG